jgi:hypothetical protein
MASTIPLLRRDADSITSVLPEFGLDVAVLENDERAGGDDRRVCEWRHEQQPTSPTRRILSVA